MVKSGVEVVEAQLVTSAFASTEPSPWLGRSRCRRNSR